MIGQFRIVGIAGIVVLAVGCGTDYRISFSEFMQLQEQFKEEHIAPPSEEILAERRGVIEERLGEYRVGPGDELVVTPTAPIGSDLITVQVLVDRDGRIDLPYVGKISVSGMELEDVEVAVKNAYVPEIIKDLTIHVSLAAPQQTEVLVTGAVSQPGLVPLQRDQLDVLHAVAVAGGINPAATGKVTVKRLRDPTESMTLDLSNPSNIAVALSQPSLQVGDIVVVEGAPPSQIYVGGLVNAPRPIVVPPSSELSILHALAAAGGLRTDVFPKEATLIRRMPDGRDIQVKLDLDRMTTGRDPNIALAAGDILWVPDTLATRVQDWINRNVFIRVGGTATVNYNVRGVEYLNRTPNVRGNVDDQNLMDQFDPFGFLLAP